MQLDTSIFFSILIVNVLDQKKAGHAGFFHSTFS